MERNARAARRCAHTLVWAFLCAHCAQSPGSRTDTDDDHTDPGRHTDTDSTDAPHTDAPTDPFAPIWNPSRQAELGQGLHTIIHSLDSLHTTPVMQALTRIQSLLVGDCRSGPAVDGVLSFDGRCDDGAGRVMGGALWHTTRTQVPFEDAQRDHVSDAWAALRPHDTLAQPLLGDGFTVSGLFFVEQDNLQQVRVSGPHATLQATIDGTLVHHTLLGGPAFNDADHTGSWVDQGLTPDVVTITRVQNEHTISYVDGAISGWTGPVIGARVVGGRVTDAPELCPEEPSGTWELRHEDGTWYSVAFDPLTACDGCGDVSAATEVLGQVCIASGVP